jgi:hypothetical protein
MHRFTAAWQFAAWLALAGVFFWPAAGGGQDKVALVEEQPASPSEAIERALQQTAMFDFDQVPLADVADFIGRNFEIEVELDRVALEAVGVAADIPVTRHVRGISLRSALNLLLRDLDLTWLNQDEVLLITTIDEAEQNITTKVYPVRDLTLPPDGPGDEDYESLVAAIASTISPTSWVDAGGAGSVKAVPNAGALVVAQTSTIHQQIETLLKSLRDARAKQFNVGVAGVLEPLPSR